MADNVAVTPGVGATIATDDIGGAQYQRIKRALWRETFDELFEGSEILGDE